MICQFESFPPVEEKQFGAVAADKRRVGMSQQKITSNNCPILPHIYIYSIYIYIYMCVCVCACVNIIRGVILGKKNLKPSEIPSNTSKYQPLILNQHLAQHSTC